MGSDVGSPRAPGSGSVPLLSGVTQAQFGGATALLVGISQLLVGLYVLDGMVWFVVGSGGVLLVLFGSNLVRNRTAFHNGWKPNGEHGVVALLGTTLVTAAVLCAAGAVLIGAT